MQKLKKILEPVSIFLLLGVVFYGFFSLVHWTIWIDEWWAGTRFLYLIGGIIMSAVLMAAYSD